MSCWNLHQSMGLWCIISLILGCSPTPEASDTVLERIAGYRAQILLADEPDGAVGILELRARMEGTDGEGEEALEEHEHPAHDAHGHHDEPSESSGAAGVDAGQTPHAMSDPTADDESANLKQARPDADQPSHAAALESVSDVVIVGKIGQQASQDGLAATDFPWERGAAAFVIVDPAAEGEVAQHEHHDGEECPFCAKKKIEAQAVVQFNDHSRAPINIDARELLGLKLDDIVVVCGDAKLLGGVLMIDANQLYIRR